MLFVAHALDKPGALDQRMAVLAAHRAYLDDMPGRLGVQVLLSGPLTSDDGETMIGSFFLLDAPDRTVAATLFADDPMTRAEVWETFSLNAVTLRQNAMSETGT